MERTLVILKPSAIQRALAGKVIDRFMQKGLTVCGIKMMTLSDSLLAEHYAHLTAKPFFPLIVKSMQATPVIVMALEGVDAVAVVRHMIGATNCRKAEPGTIRGDFGISGQENIVHASDSPETAAIELKRFFADNELFSYTPLTHDAIYAPDEL